MSNLGVSIEEIATSIEVFSRNAGGGFIDQNDREYLVRNIGRTTSISDLRELTVAIRDARNIRLDQVASIGFGARTKRGEAGFQGSRPSSSQFRSNLRLILWCLLKKLN